MNGVQQQQATKSSFVDSSEYQAFLQFLQKHNLKVSSLFECISLIQFNRIAAHINTGYRRYTKEGTK
jgi:hypothetical protein